jgi:hypothetical protein
METEPMGRVLTEATITPPPLTPEAGERVGGLSFSPLPSGERGVRNRLIAFGRTRAGPVIPAPRARP